MLIKSSANVKKCITEQLTHMSGWNNWPCKQDLYRVKFAVDEMLKNTSTFTGEEEWLLEQEKEQVWKILKR
jgi:hypothetical protein